VHAREPALSHVVPDSEDQRALDLRHRAPWKRHLGTGCSGLHECQFLLEGLPEENEPAVAGPHHGLAVEDEVVIGADRVHADHADHRACVYRGALK
jgi:hypothetical protein